MPFAISPLPPTETRGSAFNIRKNMTKSGETADHQNLELLKAVAQAWHAHSSDSYSDKEFSTRRTIRFRPSRFKLEAEAAAAAAASAAAVPSLGFDGSLWDSYEIVAIAKKLESCNLTLDQPLQLPPPYAGANRQGKRRRESKKSLRSLFYKTRSRRVVNSEMAEGAQKITLFSAQ